MSQHDQLPYFNVGKSDNSSSESLIPSFNDDSENEFKVINENLEMVRDVMRNLVPLGTVKVAKDIIIEPVIDYVFENCKQNPNIVFVTLYYAREVQEMENENEGEGPALCGMRKKRIECSELLAREL